MPTNTKYSLAYIASKKTKNILVFSLAEVFQVVKNLPQSPFPKRLKEARVNAGLSQKELGIRIGLDEFTSSPRMNQYEKGKHAPAFAIVKAISRELGVPTAFFYCEEEELAKFIRTFKT